MRVGSRNGEGACQYVQAKSRFSCDRVGSPPVHLSRFLLHSKHYPSLEGLQSPTPLYSNKWSTVSFWNIIHFGYRPDFALASYVAFQSPFSEPRVL